MAGRACELGGPIRIADYLSLELLARLVPPALVERALTKYGSHSRRQRDLPAHIVAYDVMALSLYRVINTKEVLRAVTEGRTWGRTRSAARSASWRSARHAPGWGRRRCARSPRRR
jgi:hypothetical protein